MPYALITGASKGIGRAIAEELANKNMDLLLVARNETLLQETATTLSDQYHIKAHYLSVDLANPNAAQEIMDWCKQNLFDINILVNNAGYGLSGHFENYTLQEQLDNVQVNITVPVQLTYLLLPSLKLQSKAYILNIASSAAYQAVPGLSLYAASKSFILNFSRGLHYELKKTNVSVTAVSPGSTDTDFAKRANVIGEKALKMAAKVNMQPTEVAKIAVDAMFAGKTEVITGLINKIGAFLVWLMPKSVAEKTAASFYEM